MEPLDTLDATLDRFFGRSAPIERCSRVIVAFSGGTDSTALLLGLARLAGRRGFEPVAAHLDHGLDPGSADRARAAVALASEVGVRCTVARREVAAARGSGESVEQAARRVRYGFLEEVRRAERARWTATAHHRDDQAETVLLRIAQGSGIEGLAGIRPRAGRLVRPLLGLPRAALAGAVAAAGLAPLADPTNRDLARPRNRLRHRVLPALAADQPALAATAAELAEAARRAAAALERRVAAAIEPRRGGAGPLEQARGGASCRSPALRALPPELLPHALALLHRLAGALYPAGRRARAELERQLSLRRGADGDQSGGGGRVACDCGGGWRWEDDGRRFALRPARPRAAPFSYTLAAPGELEIPELGLRLRLFSAPVEPWMFRGSPRRAGLALPLVPGERVTVRSRRPGDRLQPLGAPGRRRLKEVLVDRRVPLRLRDRLPLVCLGERGERIAWVPGVTVDERYRLGAGSVAWVAELDREVADD